MELGLHWIRRRQRSLAKGVLALFCLAWLQVAAVPCVMAEGHGTTSSPLAAGLTGDAMHSGQPAGADGDPAEHCHYCPPPEDPGTAQDSSASCAYPHGPQVDARLAFGAFVPVLATFAWQAVEPVTGLSDLLELQTLRPPLRVPITVSYCRFIE